MQFSNFFFALIIALVVLAIIEKIAPAYAWAYVVLVVLSIVLTQRGAVLAFAGQMQSWLSPTAAR